MCVVDRYRSVPGRAGVPGNAVPCLPRHLVHSSSSFGPAQQCSKFAHGGIPAPFPPSSFSHRACSRTSFPACCKPSSTPNHPPGACKSLMSPAFHLSFLSSFFPLPLQLHSTVPYEKRLLPTLPIDTLDCSSAPRPALFTAPRSKQSQSIF